MKKVITLLSIILFIVFGLAAFASAESLQANYRLTSTGLHKYTSGIIYDPKTKLEWYMGPDRDMDWYEASRWIEDLKIEGGRWEMPANF